MLGGDILDVLITVVSFLVMLCVLVAIHEYGHFWVARKCGVKVLRFSIGFGPILATWSDSKGTEWAISAIPLGGYVKMLDDREGDVDESEMHLTHNNKHPSKKIAIAAAGPLANFILAVLLYWALFASQGTIGLSPVVGEVEPGSIAEHAKLEAGQEIVAIDGVLTPTRKAVHIQLLNHLGETGSVEFLTRYPDSNLTYGSRGFIQDWMKEELNPDPIKGLGLSFYVPELPKVIEEVVEGSAAESAGILPKDELLRADGDDIGSWAQWVELVKSKPGVPIKLDVLREGVDVSVILTPQELEAENGETFGRAGVTIKVPQYPEDMVRREKYSVFGALIEGSKETWETSGIVLLSMRKLILGEISTKNLSGPIGIAKVAGDSARSGFWTFISLLAMISIYLGVLNLLPIPILDGGHIIYAGVEWISGNPVSEKLQVIGNQLGLVMIMCVMVVAFYNDIFL